FTGTKYLILVESIYSIHQFLIKIYIKNIKSGVWHHFAAGGWREGVPAGGDLLGSVSEFYLRASARDAPPSPRLCRLVRGPVLFFPAIYAIITICMP
ncbi:hypothetical protein, partial [Treponema primitia]|uniref:hypothetical protein n=1 Tax=Treponema primitia TaxID=88058 RepID=UPI000255526A